MTEVRKAEADAEARKAEADAEVRKAEAEVRKAEAGFRKAEIGAASLSVGFEYLPIKVTHWKSLVSHYIQVPRSACSFDFDEFKVLVRLIFNDDITTDEFRLYVLPVDCEIDQRILVDEKCFREFVESITSSSKNRLPSMFVWNYENSSPAKLPGAHEAEVTGSQASRSSAQSTACRDAYDSKCLCCGSTGEITNHAAHIVDYGHYKKKGNGRPFLKQTGLVYINELANLICLCPSCHIKFDNFRLGIDPTEKMWTVSTAERKEGPEFCTHVHGKKIVFYANGAPPEQALMWKWLRFVEKNKARYCCFCESVFPTASSTEQTFDDHKLACKLQAATIADTAK